MVLLRFRRPLVVVVDAGANLKDPNSEKTECLELSGPGVQRGTERVDGRQWEWSGREMGLLKK